MEQEKVRYKARAAIARLLESDAYLLKVDVNERSITHRLASYLQGEFGDWDVDCEYNRNREDTKQLRVPEDLEIPVCNVQTDDTQARTVFPDIIVHRRETNENLLVIEVKKTTSRVSSDFDLWKLCEFRNQLGYRYALFLKFITGHDDEVDVAEEKWIEEEEHERLQQALRRGGLHSWYGNEPSQG